MSRDNFIIHNKKIFKKNFQIENNNEILVEFNGWQLPHIINSYLANVLSLRFKAKIKSFPADNGFHLKFFPYFIKYLKWKIINYLTVKNFKIYKSFNVENFFLPNLDAIQILNNKKLYHLIIPKINNKLDLLNLKIKNIHVGDLIYNSYLLDFKEPINVQDSRFKNYFYKSLGLFIYWYDYLKSHEVKAIILTHSVYFSAINLRIALNFGIPVYSANDEIVYKFSKNNLHPWIDFINFKKFYSSLSKKKKIAAIKRSIEQVNSRVSGSMKYFIDVYKTSYPFQQKKNKNRVILKSKKIKILVAAHCFYDSPHVYGKMFFHDFHDWLDYLGKLSLNTDYDWYIKSHKNYFPKSRIEIENFSRKYKKFKLLPAEVSHHQIIEEKIDLALSCYGTIGWEYPFLGVPVLLSSINNPYVNYNFNIKPKNFSEYDKILKSLDKQFLQKEKNKINKKEIYEYYFMNYIYGKKTSWLLKGLDSKGQKKLFHAMRTRNIAYSNKIYEIWQKKFTTRRHYLIINMLNNYFESKKISSNFL
jgi:hypothetical protein